MRDSVGASARPQLLLIEDDSAVRRMLGFPLRRAGFDVHEAASGAQGLQMMEDGPFDAVVLELDFLDVAGEALLERLRRNDRKDHHVWVVISGLDERDITRRYGQLEAPFVAKPFEPWELVRILRELLTGAAAAGT